jgi:hypothetical protein
LLLAAIHLRMACPDEPPRSFRATMAAGTISLIEWKRMTSLVSW